MRPLVALFVAYQCGCTAKLAITSLEPSSIFFGSHRELVVVGGEGKRKPRELVFSQLTVRRTGWTRRSAFTVPAFVLYAGRIDQPGFDCLPVYLSVNSWLRYSTRTPIRPRGDGDMRRSEDCHWKGC